MQRFSACRWSCDLAGDSGVSEDSGQGQLPVMRYSVSSLAHKFVLVQGLINGSVRCVTVFAKPRSEITQARLAVKFRQQLVDRALRVASLQMTLQPIDVQRRTFLARSAVAS